LKIRMASTPPAARDGAVSRAIKCQPLYSYTAGHPTAQYCYSGTAKKMCACGVPQNAAVRPCLQMDNRAAAGAGEDRQRHHPRRIWDSRAEQLSTQPCPRHERLLAQHSAALMLAQRFTSDLRPFSPPHLIRRDEPRRRLRERARTAKYAAMSRRDAAEWRGQRAPVVQSAI